MNKIRVFKSIEEMNDDDVNFIFQKSMKERIEYFQTINEMFHKDGSELRAYREFFRWLSLLDDRHLFKFIHQKEQ